MDNKQFLSILAQRLNLEPATAEKLLSGFTAVVGEECQQLNRVALPALGSFGGVKKEETVITDLSTGRRLMLPPAIEMEFIPAARLRNVVAEGHRK